jgi:hypothetical protein
MTASASNGAKHGFRRLVPLTTRRGDGTTSCAIFSSLLRGEGPYER